MIVYNDYICKYNDDIMITSYHDYYSDNNFNDTNIMYNVSKLQARITIE